MADTKKQLADKLWALTVVTGRLPEGAKILQADTSNGAFDGKPSIFLCDGVTDFAEAEGREVCVDKDEDEDYDGILRYVKTREGVVVFSYVCTGE